MLKIIRLRLINVLTQGSFRPPSSTVNGLEIDEIKVCQTCNVHHHEANICTRESKKKFNDSGSEKCAEDEWQRYFKKHSNKHQTCALELIGWGSALAVGLHLSHIWHDFIQWRLKNKKKLDTWLFSCPWTKCSNLLRKSVLEFDYDAALLNNESAGHVKIRNLCPQLNFVSSTPEPSASYATASPIQPISVSAAVNKTPLHVFHIFGITDDPEAIWPKASEQPHEAFKEPTSEKDVENLRTLEKEWDLITHLFEGDKLNAEAVKMAKVGRELEAVALWEKSANEHNCDKAYYNLGVAYQSGRGVACDVAKALMYFQRAGDEGHVKGMFNAALLLLEQNSKSNYSKAKSLLMKAASTGLTEAQTQLAVLCLEEGNSPECAVELLIKAVEKGHTPAKYLLAICYEKGLGLQENAYKAANLYQQASDAGHIDATYNLAVFYERGLGGLSVDKAAAMALYARAAELGDSTALFDLERLRSDIIIHDGLSYNKVLNKRKELMDAVSMPNILLQSQSLILNSSDHNLYPSGMTKDRVVSFNTAEEITESSVKFHSSRVAKFILGEDLFANPSEDVFEKVEYDELAANKMSSFHRVPASENNLCILVN